MSLHLHLFGDTTAPVLVCLHGVGGHGARFRRLAEQVPDRRIVAPDLRGHGGSTCDPPWTTEQHAIDVLDALAAYPHPFDLLGFSFGARVAACLCELRPSAVRRLVLLDPALSVPPSLAATEAQRALIIRSYATVGEAVTAALTDGTLFTTPRDIIEEDILAHYSRGVDGRLVSRVCRPMEVTAWSELARPAPARVDVPTLLVTGARSWLPVDVPRLRPTRHVTVPGGHSVLWDDLPLTAEAVRDFIRSPVSAATRAGGSLSAADA